jgi:hypothetical protein
MIRIVNWVKSVWEFICGYLYDFGADLKGIKPIEEIDDEEES